jgi:hypothetical protein
MCEQVSWGTKGMTQAEALPTLNSRKNIIETVEKEQDGTSLCHIHA